MEIKRVVDKSKPVIAPPVLRKVSKRHHTKKYKKKKTRVRKKIPVIKAKPGEITEQIKEYIVWQLGHEVPARTIKQKLKEKFSFTALDDNSISVYKDRDKWKKQLRAAIKDYNEGLEKERLAKRRTRVRFAESLYSNMMSIVTNTKKYDLDERLKASRECRNLLEYIRRECQQSTDLDDGTGGRLIVEVVEKRMWKETVRMEMGDANRRDKDDIKQAVDSDGNG